MAIGPGSTIGPFKIQSLIGKGGMGEVFSAVDTRLERSVAIKVLPPEFSSDSEVRARFEREARAISNLTHPHICTLYDIGRENGTDYLVMERLEGQTLAERLKKGRLPLEQALEYGIQIAAALDRAHRAGIVHRDLKPGNIMLTKNGVKLLDFGLAKFSGKTQKAAAEDQATLLEKTSPGMILGTVQYMAPEQVEAGEVDHRTDIFAFGCVLYEMITGKKAFEGKSATSVMAAILEREPVPLERSHPCSPTSLDHLLKYCLAKSPEDRWQNIHDLKLELERVRSFSENIVATQKRSNWTLVWAIGATVGGLVLAGIVALTNERKLPQGEISRFVFTPPASVFPRTVTISPDGRKIVFLGAKDGKTHLYLRALDSLNIVKLERTEGANYPFWSPDSLRIGFFTDNGLKAMSLADGSVQTVSSGISRARGASWNGDGLILISPTPEGPLFSVSDKGGELKQVTTIRTNEHRSHRFPYFLPDGNKFLFLALDAGGAMTHAGIYLGDLQSDRIQKLFAANRNAAFVPPETVIFARDGSLVAQQIDAKTGRVRGIGSVIAQGVGSFSQNFEAFFSVSTNGILIYKKDDKTDTELAWYDRDGKLLSLAAPVGDYQDLSLSPDNKKVAFTQSLGESAGDDIWALDLSSGGRTRITTAAQNDFAPVWGPDSQALFFTSRRTPAGIYRWTFGSALSEELFFPSASPFIWAGSVSSDGKFLLVTENQAEKGANVIVVPIDDPTKTLPLRATSFNEGDPSISPDGKWVAYYSDESGEFQIYLQSFPGGAEKHGPVSRGLAGAPRWNPKGGELFYISGVDNTLYSVKFKSEPALSIAPPVPLFEVPIVRRTYMRWKFGVSGDGQRFLINRAVTPETNAPVTVVLNWPALLPKAK